ncbi:MAG: hypothetical protein L3J19_01845 [Sulfurimonas sp.]|nr:hypothetical protein [Sulfurimonas sp.]
MDETVEDLEEQLQETLNKIENIAVQAAEKQIDAYEGFMQTEKYKDKIMEIGNKLKERGVDITTLSE